MSVEVPASASGVLLRIDVVESVASIDHPVAWIGKPGEELPPLFVSGAKAHTTIASIASTEAPAIPSGVAAASHAARRLARELDIDVSSICGTSPGGRVTEADVNRARGAS